MSSSSPGGVAGGGGGNSARRKSSTLGNTFLGGVQQDDHHQHPLHQPQRLPTTNSTTSAAALQGRRASKPGLNSCRKRLSSSTNQILTAQVTIREIIKLLAALFVGFILRGFLDSAITDLVEREHQLHEARSANQVPTTSCPQCPIRCGESSGLALPPYIPKTRFEVIRYDYLDERYIYGNIEDDPKIGLLGYHKRTMRELEQNAVQYINLKEKILNKWKFFKLIRGYQRFEPGRGVEYILDIKVRSTSNSSEYREYRVETFQSLQPVQVTERGPPPAATTSPHPGGTVYLLLPVPPGASANTRLREFLVRYERELLTPSVSGVYLLLILSPGGASGEARLLVRQLNKRYPKAYIRTVEREVEGDGGGDSDEDVENQISNFNRSAALDLATLQLPKNALMFFTDVDIYVKRDFIEKCRLNTHAGRQIFFPIVFSQYKPEIVKAYSPRNKADDWRDINKYTGHWLHYSFGMVCLYNEDYQAVGGFSSTTNSRDLSGQIVSRTWGGDEGALYEKYMRSDTFTIFRSMEPSLTQIYHGKYCDPTLQRDRYRACLDSISDNYGSRTQLAKKILQRDSFE